MPPSPEAVGDGAGFGTGAAVAHRQEEIDDEFLKEAGGLRHDAVRRRGWPAVWHSRWDCKLIGVSYSWVQECF